MQRTIQNNLHQEVESIFSRFLELKREYENKKTSHINFNETILSDNIDEDDSIEFFITRNSNLYIYSKFENKLSSGIDNIPNVLL